MDDLERRIRAARPVSGHRNLPLTDRAKRELAELMLQESSLPTSRSTSTRAHTRWWFGIAAAALVVVAAVAIPVRVLTSAPSHAATPALLAVTPVQGTASELLRELSLASRAANTLPPTGTIHIQVETWTLATDNDGIARGSTILPERHDITREPDGTLTTKVTAGKPVGTIRPDTPTEGELLRLETLAPEAADYEFGTPAPEDSDDVARFLARTPTSETLLTAAASIDAISSLLLEQTLSPAQTQAILNYLADLPDITVTGATLDRHGREGITFSAVDRDHPEYSAHLVIATSTSQILAIERTYTGSDRTDIASPSVVQYYIWG